MVHFMLGARTEQSGYHCYTTLPVHVLAYFYHSFYSSYLLRKLRALEVEGEGLVGGDWWKGALSVFPTAAAVDRLVRQRRRKEGCGVESSVRCCLFPFRL